MCYKIDEFKNLLLEKMAWNYQSIYAKKGEEAVRLARKMALTEILSENRCISIELEDGNIATCEPEHMATKRGFTNEGFKMFSDFLYSYEII